MHQGTPESELDEHPFFDPYKPDLTDDSDSEGFYLQFSENDEESESDREECPRTESPFEYLVIDTELLATNLQESLLACPNWPTANLPEASDVVINAEFLENRSPPSVRSRRGEKFDILTCSVRTFLRILWSSESKSIQVPPRIAEQSGKLSEGQGSRINEGDGSFARIVIDCEIDANRHLNLLPMPRGGRIMRLRKYIITTIVLVWLIASGYRFILKQIHNHNHPLKRDDSNPLLTSVVDLFGLVAGFDLLYKMYLLEA